MGCGNGRMAIPLTSYLSHDGEYQGFDIVKKGIVWCRNKITPRFPHFHFEHSNIYNKFYNNNGTIDAKEFKFNFPSNHFDVVFLTSVFTHMITADVENYLSEIARVLKTGGKCLITVYIINDESKSLMKYDGSLHDFNERIDDNCYSTKKNMAEACIGFDEQYLKEIYSKNGLEIIQPVQYGYWCGRSDYLSAQDIVVAQMT